MNATLELVLWTGLVGLPAVPLAIAIFNVFFWPRGRTEEPHGSVSVCIPARNEESNIGPCLDAVMLQSDAFDEVVVLDDGSTDQTPEILAQRQHPKLRVLRHDGPLPDGWVGKAHACHLLTQAAQGDTLVFIDADTVVSPEGLSKVHGLFADFGAQAITAVPRQRVVGFFERLMLPLLHLTYAAWLPMPLVWKTHNPRLLAANGQILAIRRDALRSVGGFRAIAHEVVDDMALCRLLKRKRHRVVFADGFDIAETRMYTSTREVWQGFSKNLYEGIGGNLVALMLVDGLYFCCLVLPYLGLVAGIIWPAVLQPAALGVGINMVLRVVLAWRYRQPPEGVLLHPFAVLGLMALSLNSLFWARRGTIHWRGRTYGARAERLAAGGAG